MSIGKLCLYLYEIGFIPSESVQDFLDLHEKLNKNKSGNDTEKMKLTLYTYLSQKLNSKQSINKFSNNIVDSFSKQIVLNRYASLKLLYNVIFSVLRSRYIMFLSKINFFLFNQNYNDNNIKGIKKGIIRKNKKTNNENNKEDINDEKRLKLNNEYDLNQHSPSLHQKYYLIIKEAEKLEKEKDNNKNNNISSNENEDNEEEIIKVLENKLSKINSCKNIKKHINKYYGNDIDLKEFLQREEDHKRKVREKIIKLYNHEVDRMITSVTFYPQINPRSKELMANKSIKETPIKKKAIKAFDKTSLKDSPKQKGIYFNSLEKKNLKEMQENNKKQKEKQKRKENRVRKEISKNIETIKKNFNEEELINRLYKRFDKIKPKEEKNIYDNINIFKRKEKQTPKKKEKIIKPKEKEKSKIKENNNIQKKEDNLDKKDENKDNKLITKDNEITSKNEDEDKKEKNEINQEIEKNKEETSKKEKESLKSGDDNIRESNLSSSLNIEKLQREFNDKLLNNLQNTGSLKSEALNNILNQNDNKQ